MIIHVCVGPACEGEDAGADRVREAPWRAAPSVAMSEGSRPLALEAPPEPPEMPRRDAQQPGGFVPA